jgi:hypothetical protein
MSLLGLNLTLSIGAFVPSPVPAALAQALQSVEVTHTDEGPSGFQLTFYADRSGAFNQDYPLLNSTLLQPFNRVLITVTFNGTPLVLMDGLITHQQLTPGNASQPSSLVITGEDLSVLMDMVEVSFEYPLMDDALVVAAVLVKYESFGVLPFIVPTLNTFIRTPLEGAWQQMETDRKYLLKLAANNGYVFYVEPGPVSLTNTAYWGPLHPPGAVPQKALTVNMGPFTNVETINFSYDALAVTGVLGTIQDPDSNLDVPLVIETSSPARTPLSSNPAISAQRMIKHRLFNSVVQCSQGYQRFINTFEAVATAQSITDQSTANVVTAEGELDVLSYGGLLSAHGLVGVRGAGYSYDGTWYVKSVTHTISNSQYKQRFTLTREGLGSLSNEVQP